MEGAYRNFHKYMEGLQGLLKHSKTPDCDWVIFVDNSVMKFRPFKHWIDEEVMKMPHVAVTQYYCKNFIKKGTDYQSGTFGSIMRFYPMTLDGLQGYKAVYVCDVDMKPYEVTQRFIEDIFENKAVFGYFSRACYRPPWIPNSVTFPVVNYRIITTQTFPFELFKLFLDNIKTKYYNKYLKDIVEADKKKTRQHILTENDIFVYGMDELFTNHFFLNYYKLTKSPGLVWLYPYINNLHKYFPDFVASNKMNYEKYNNLYIKGLDQLNDVKDIQNLNIYMKELTSYVINQNFKGVEEFIRCISLGALYFDYIDNNKLEIPLLVPYIYHDQSNINPVQELLEYKKSDKHFNYGIVFDHSDKFKYDSSFCTNIEFHQLLNVINKTTFDTSYKRELIKINEYDESILTGNALKLFKILKYIYDFKNYKFEFIKDSGLQKSDFTKLKKWNENTTGKKFMALTTNFGIFQSKPFFSPFFKTSDYTYWDYVDESIGRHVSDVSFTLFIKAYISIYNNIQHKHKEQSASTFKKEDFMEIFCGGKERINFLKSFFDYCLEHNIHIIIISHDRYLEKTYKLFKDLFSVLIPSKKFDLFYANEKFEWNKMNKLIAEGYGSVCDEDVFKSLSSISINKTRKHIHKMNKTRKLKNF